MVEMDQNPDQSERRFSNGAVDFAFLGKQTFGDAGLARELLLLFDAQARRIMLRLPDLTPQAQADAVHLLKGSALGIGAWDAAEMAARYEAAPSEARSAILPSLIERFVATVSAIEAYLFTDASS